MTGRYLIKMHAGNVMYELDIKRKITIITGDSATSKTIFHRRIDSAIFNKEVYMFKNNNFEKSDVKLRAINLSNLDLLSYISNSIVAIDEDLLSNKKLNVISLVLKSDNYFILITRNTFEHISYAISEIYTLIDDTNSFIKLKHHYKIKPLYDIPKVEDLFNNSLILVEDSGIGLDMYKAMFPGDIVISSNGKANIIKCLLNQCKDASKNINNYNYKFLFIVVDGAAFGCHINELFNMIGNKSNVFIIAPESFEYLLLKALYYHEIPESLDRPYDDERCTTLSYKWLKYKSTDGSWEKYFEMIINIQCEKHRLSYSKNNSKFNSYFLSYSDKFKALLLKEDTLVNETDLFS